MYQPCILVNKIFIIIVVYYTINILYLLDEKYIEFVFGGYKLINLKNS